MPRLLGGPRRALLVRLALNGLAQAAAVVAVAWSIRASLDGDAPPGTAALKVVSIGAVAAVSMALLRWRERVDAEALAQGYVLRIRIRLLDKLARVEPAALQGSSHGGLLLRFAGDLTAIALWVGRGIARLVVCGIVVAVVLTAIATVQWPLALALGLGLGLMVAAAFVRAPRLDDAVVALRTARGRLTTRINTALRTLPDLDRSGALPRETATLGRRARTVRGAAVARAREAALVDAIAEVGAFAIPVAVVALALLAPAARITPGELAAVLGIALLVGGPLRESARAYEYWRHARIARAKVAQFFAFPDKDASRRARDGRRSRCVDGVPTERAS